MNNKFGALANTLGKSVNLVHHHDPIISDECNGNPALATSCYNGSHQSFQIACINVAASPKLRIYGLHSFEVVLKCISQMFHALELHRHAGFVMSHYGHKLIKLINTTIPWTDGQVIYLDIADIIDEVHAPLKPSSSLSEIVDQIEPNESPGVGDPCTCCDESQLQYIDQLDCIRCDSDDMEHQEIQREIPFQDTLNKDTWGRSRNLVLIITVVVVLLALSAANEKS